jgi:putative FmdB family regulatory protein
MVRARRPKEIPIMPIHEYRCKKCGANVEALQKAKDKPLEKCPKCGGPLLKLISSPAIQFKGTGWYITDYGKKNSPSPEAKAAAKPEPAKEKKGGPKPSPSSSQD